MKKNRNFSIGKKIMAIGCLISVMISTALGCTFYFYAKNALLDETSKYLLSTVTMASKLIDGDEMASIQKGDENTASYQTIFNTLEMMQNSYEIEYIYTVRKGSIPEGELIVDGDLNPESRVEIGYPFSSMEEAKTVFEGKTLALNKITDDSWGKYISTYAPIYTSNGSISGILAIDFSVSSIYETLRIFMFRSFLLSAAALIISILIWWRASNMLSKRIKVVCQHVESLSNNSGDLTQYIKNAASDETGILASSINKLIGSFRSIIESTQHTTQTVSQTAEGIDSAILSLSEGFDNIHLSTNEIADNMTEQTTAVSESSDMLNRIYESITKLTIDIESILSISEQATATAENGNKKLKNAALMVEENAKLVQTVNQNSNELSNIVKNIESIVSVIDSISYKTNLLALNASIEAASAGAAGKGFAVVADEIRHLASQTAEATGNIRMQVTEIHNTTQTTVNSIESFADVLNVQKSAFSDMTDIIHLFHENFLHIEQKMTSLNGHSGKISEESASLKDCIQVLQHSISEINNQIHELAASGDEQQHSVEDIVEQMKYLNETSSELLILVEHFQV